MRLEKGLIVLVKVVKRADLQSAHGYYAAGRGSVLLPRIPGSQISAGSGKRKKSRQGSGFQDSFRINPCTSAALMEQKALLDSCHERWNQAQSSRHAQLSCPHCATLPLSKHCSFPSAC
jgi:hypothetical protein